MISYFEKIIDLLSIGEVVEETEDLKTNHSLSKNIVVENDWFPRRIGVVDGGSNVISLNIGYIGVISSIGVIIENNVVVDRVIPKPEVLPINPDEIFEYETIDILETIVDRMREALVFETARKLLSRDIELLIIDGPIIPYGALGKIVKNTESEWFSINKYENAIINLHNDSIRKETSVIGFVKRPRSKYFKTKFYDHIYLSNYLGEGEYSPDPPGVIDLKTIHEENIRRIAEIIKPKYVFIRLTNSTPPYRVDLGHLNTDYRKILSYIYITRTREGIPYAIMKADEEAKITKRLMREIYDDVLHYCIYKYLRLDPSRIIPLLPEYGGV